MRKTTIAVVVLALLASESREAWTAGYAQFPTLTAESSALQSLFWERALAPAIPTTLDPAPVFLRARLRFLNKFGAETAVSADAPRRGLMISVWSWVQRMLAEYSARSAHRLLDKVVERYRGLGLDFDIEVVRPKPGDDVPSVAWVGPGVERPKIRILQSFLVLLTEPEIAYVIGHEWGHPEHRDVAFTQLVQRMGRERGNADIMIVLAGHKEVEADKVSLNFLDQLEYPRSAALSGLHKAAAYIRGETRYVVHPEMEDLRMQILEDNLTRQSDLTEAYLPFFAPDTAYALGARFKSQSGLDDIHQRARDLFDLTGALMEAAARIVGGPGTLQEDLDNALDSLDREIRDRGETEPGRRLYNPRDRRNLFRLGATLGTVDILEARAENPLSGLSRSEVVFYGSELRDRRRRLVTLFEDILQEGSRTETVRMPSRRARVRFYPDKLAEYLNLSFPFEMFEKLIQQVREIEEARDALKEQAETSIEMQEVRVDAAPSSTIEIVPFSIELSAAEISVTMPAAVSVPTISFDQNPRHEPVDGGSRDSARAREETPPQASPAVTRGDETGGNKSEGAAPGQNSRPQDSRGRWRFLLKPLLLLLLAFPITDYIPRVATSIVEFGRVTFATPHLPPLNDHARNGGIYSTDIRHFAAVVDEKGNVSLQSGGWAGADPRVFPLGSTIDIHLRDGRVYTFRVADTGRLLKGDRINLSITGESPKIRRQFMKLLDGARVTGDNGHSFVNASNRILPQPVTDRTITWEKVTGPLVALWPLLLVILASLAHRFFTWRRNRYSGSPLLAGQAA